MKEQTDNDLESLTKKLFEGMDKETPSFDFTYHVMAQVDALAKNKVTTYQPLISKTGWILIGSAFIAFIAYILYSNQVADLGWFDAINFNVFTNNEFTEGLSRIALPKTVVYAIVLFGLMLCVQIPFLKHHFDKRYEV